MPHRAASIRTVALVGHGDSGKTSFAEHALFKAGAVARAGTIGDRSTVCDHDADERDVGHSIDACTVHFTWKGKDVILVDCPGYPDFAGAATAGMWACDLVLVFVSAVTGVGVNTRRMWEAAGAMGKARAIVISKMDAENADPERVFAQVQSAFGPRCRAFNLPVGAGAGFKSVTPCFEDERPEGGNTLCGDPGQARSAFFEAVVEADDALLERYLAGDEIKHDEAAGALTAAISKGTVVPVLFLSSVRGFGLGQCMDFLAEDAPSAAQPLGIRAVYEGAKDSPVSADGPFLASVWKVAIDAHVGKIAYLRVWRGELPADGNAWCSAGGGTVRLGHAHPSRPFGKELRPVKSVGAGDIVAVTKVEELKLGCTLADPAAKCTVAPPEFPAPMAHYAVESKAKGDEHKVSAAFHKVQDEDPSFRTGRSADTHEMIISGLSTLHLETILRRLSGRYKVELEHRLPKVPLKETVLGRAEGQWRHKKQSGGRGQFAEVHLRVAPNARGAGFRFVNATVGGSIPHNFIPAVEKGVREQMDRGVIAGYPLVDVVVEAFDGKSHPVDSSEAAFKIASSRALRDAVEKAAHALLEPIMEIEIDIPSGCMGDVTGDLNTRRGRISGMDAHDDRQVIRAHVPLSEIQTYAADLRSMSSGEGSYSQTFSHLDVVPANVAKKHIDAWHKHRAPDED
ncbi:MAG: Elongation factor G [Planctomycetes bacterium]|nr:Elongation factor G [Planctomycetota bacterium]